MVKNAWRSYGGNCRITSSASTVACDARVNRGCVGNGDSGDSFACEFVRNDQIDIRAVWSIRQIIRAGFISMGLALAVLDFVAGRQESGYRSSS